MVIPNNKAMVTPNNKKSLFELQVSTAKPQHTEEYIMHTQLTQL